MNFKTVTGEAPHADIRILKCYLANDSQNHFVTADEVCNGPGHYWTCASCGCRLRLYTGDFGEHNWFEHDQRSVAYNELIKCTWVDPAVKAADRERKLRKGIRDIQTPIRISEDWYCVLCDSKYRGQKKCPICLHGIYSTELVHRDISRRAWKWAR